MGLKAARVYLDTNAIIRAIESAETTIASIFAMAASGSAEIFTSELTLAEVMVIPIRNGDQALIDAYDAFLQDDEIMTVVPIDRRILLKSAELRAVEGGKTPDAIHVATAIATGCAIVVSSDMRLRMPPGMTRLSIEDADAVDLRA